MNALIFAAGLGTRLYPLTLDKPKALVEINGKTLLEITILRLKEIGIKTVVVNVHHFPDLIIDYLKSHDYFGVDILISDERNFLLETGGGIVKAATLIDKNTPLLVHNVDIVSDINLQALFDYHMAYKAEATLAVRQRKTSRYLLFNPSMHLCGWENQQTGEKKIIIPQKELQAYAFSGIQIINPSILADITQEGKFSIISAYLELLHKHRLIGYDHTSSQWIDVGKQESLEQAAKCLV